MQDERGRIVEASSLDADCCLLKIAAPRIASQARPGNFVMVRISPSLDPLLRRPFGILQCAPPHIWLYFQVRGRGTRMLGSLRSGDSLDILGPLGNAFPEFPGKKILLIAGGRGIVPLFHYAKVHALHRQLLLLYGGRSAVELHLLEEIKTMPFEKIFLFSEDGSAGQKGLLTDGLEKILREERPEASLSCGPEAMLSRLARMLKPGEMENHASLEALMGCGFGVCHSCAVLDADGGYRKVCDEGPVFPLQEIQWPN